MQTYKNFKELNETFEYKSFLRVFSKKVLRMFSVCSNFFKLFGQKQKVLCQFNSQMIM